MRKIIIPIVATFLFVSCSNTGTIPMKIGQDTRAHLCSQGANSIFKNLEVLKIKQEKKNKEKSDSVSGVLLFPESKPKNICQLELTIGDTGGRVSYALMIHSKGKAGTITNFAGTAIGDETEHIIDRCEIASGREKIWYKPNFYLERDLKSGDVKVEGSREGSLDNFVCLFQ